MRALLLLSVLFALGCPSTSGSADCDYTLDDPCITADNLQQCEDMAAQCPGQVLVMESCPLQFGCP